MSNVEHLFIYLLANCMSLEKHLFKSSAYSVILIQPYSWHESAPCPDRLQAFLCGHIAAVIHQFSSVQSLSCDRLFVTPWTAASQASLFITDSQNLLKLMSIESVMPSNHLILCRPLLLLPFAVIHTYMYAYAVIHIYIYSYSG